jgi:hypothetical protein
MVNPSPTHKEIDGDIVKTEGLIAKPFLKLITDVITHGMMLKHDGTSNDVEAVAADATVRPVYIANVTEANTSGNGDKDCMCVIKGWAIKKVSSIIKVGAYGMTDADGIRIKAHDGVSEATKICKVFGHLNEGDRKYPYTNLAVNDFALIYFFGGGCTG